MVFENLKINIPFLHTPSEIRTSIFAVTQFAAARHYAQCHFKQNMHYSVGGVEKNKKSHSHAGRRREKNVHGSEGGNEETEFLDTSSAGSAFLICKKRRG